MRCKYCGEQIVRSALGWLHMNGWYACVTVPTLENHYADLEGDEVGDVEAKKISSAPAGVMDEEKVCGCGARQVGNCESCGAALCVDCDSGDYVDVMKCRDAEACERRLRRKAVADRSQSLFDRAVSI